MGGGIEQQDAILAYENSALSVSDYGNAITKNRDGPTYGAMSIDATADGLAEEILVKAGRSRQTLSNQQTV